MTKKVHFGLPNMSVDKYCPVYIYGQGIGRITHLRLEVLSGRIHTIHCPYIYTPSTLRHIGLTY